MESSNQFEKLGLFYLGRELGLVSGQPAVPRPLLLKSSTLTTHGVIIGMTGSGKTGLGIGLIEEAMMDSIPSLIIDPKGDMSNLLLSFPELRAADFRPWVDPAAASRKHLTVDQYAEATATDWREGLASWGQGGERIRALRSRSEVTVYTPGSASGVPVSIISGFACPDPEILAEQDTLTSMVASAATSLLALIGIDVDPLTSREHILVSSIILAHWQQGLSLSLESLIGAVVDPPFDKIGVFALGSFYPQAERMKLAMLLNNVVASPAFAGWLRGEPLDIQRFLYGEDGRPRTAIFSISHLSEPERMFFVTLLLNAVVGWMRRQRGTSSLKALLYMDEIFGYFPPTANPPSKKPMLLLLKQARAYGLGVLLATQNPVDLDYKGLANIGTWFVGRLQTSQDRERVLDTIVGSSGGALNRQTAQQLLADLRGRQFLLTSAHLDEPLLFETRWVMSYLKGPMSLQDISSLMAGRGFREPAAVAESTAVVGRSGGLLSQPPILGKKIEQRYFLPPVLTEEAVFEPWLACSGSVRFYNASRNIDEVRSCRLRFRLDSDSALIDWDGGEPLEIDLDGCRLEPPAGSRFYEVPPGFAELRDLGGLEKDFADYLYQNQRLELLRAPSLKLESRPGESAAEFSVRLADVLREQKDQAAEKLLKTMMSKRERLQGKLETALLKVEREREDVTATTADTVISIGTAVLGAFFGRKAMSTGTISRTATGLRKAGRVAREKAEVERAEAAVADIEGQIRELEAEQEIAVAALAEQYDPAGVSTETFAIKPRRSDIFDLRLCLLWEMIPPRLSA